MNWRELKEFCNNLTEEQLNEKVVLWREDEAINKISAIQLEEDYYIDEDWDDGCVPESDCQFIIEMNPDDYPNGLSDLRKCYSKGHPILEEEF